MNRQIAVVGLAAAVFVTVAVVIILRMDAPELAEPAMVVAAPVEAPFSTPAVATPEPAAPALPPVTAAPVAAAPIVETLSPVIDTPLSVGRLHINSDVPGAQVFIDRQFIGLAPVTAEGVEPGTHQLNVSADGFDNEVSSIDVAVGERTILVKFREVRLDVSMDVVHKHRFGSCEGRLAATPQGLRYETDNQNDGFTVSLLDLETFEVDYLDTNLRVRLADGRPLNFTNQEGDADRLFVFHRDVQDARERLRRGDEPAID